MRLVVCKVTVECEPTTLPEPPGFVDVVVTLDAADPLLTTRSNDCVAPVPTPFVAVNFNG